MPCLCVILNASWAMESLRVNVSLLLTRHVLQYYNEFNNPWQFKASVKVYSACCRP